MNEVVIAGAARTPMGGFQGEFDGVNASVLGGVALKAALDDAQIASVDELYFGITPALMIRRRPLEPVPRWKDSSFSIGPMLAARGLNAEVESMPSWNFPSRSTNMV